MGSNRTLRHKHGIRGLDSAMRRLFRRLDAAAKQVSMLCTYDSNLLDAAATWDYMLEETLELPAGLTVEGGRIMAALHDRLDDILEAYGSMSKSVALLPFLYDLVDKYSDLSR